MPLPAEQKEEIAKLVEETIQKIYLSPQNGKDEFVNNVYMRPSSLMAMEERYFQLTERIVRVEEETKHLRQDMQEGFARIDKRFEQVEKRFEQMEKQMDKRFEEMNGKFKEITQRIDRFMVWSFGIFITIAGVLIAIIKL